MGDSDGSFGSLRGRAVSGVVLLLLINVAVWLVWQFGWQSRSLHRVMSDHFTCQPSGVLEHYRVWTLLTCNFSHMDAYHILFNMLFLWYLGVDVEIFYGRKNFVALYLAAGLASSVAQLGIEAMRGSDIPSLGASGSVMGIAVVAAFIDPSKTLMIWGILPVKLWLLVTIYILMDFSGVMKNGDHIAHAAHLGGAFAGFLFYKLDLRVFASRGRKSSGLLYHFKQWWRSRKFRSIEGGRGRPPRDIPPDDRELVATKRARSKRAGASESPVLTEAAARIDPETARRVDALLAKISREGMDALSMEEQEFLRQSSQKYKK